MLSLRFIGKMARSIKSRSAPELNLVNRYLLSAYLNRRVVDVRAAGEEEALEEEAHPLVPLGAVNSLSNRESQPLVWPHFTKATSEILYKNVYSHLSERVIRPMLGKKMSDANRNAVHSDCVIRSTWSPVQIGPWTFRLSDLKLDRQRGFHTAGTCDSLFTIKHEYVHDIETVEYECKQHMDEPLQAGELLYGKLHRFIEVSLPHWSEKVYRMGECTLWRALGVHPITYLPFLNLNQPLNFNTNKQVAYVPLHRIASAFAMAPDVSGWKEQIEEKGDSPLRAKHDAAALSATFHYVLPVNV